MKCVANFGSNRVIIYPNETTEKPSPGHRQAEASLYIYMYIYIYI